MKSGADVLIVSTNRNDLPLPVMPYGACMVAEATEREGHHVRLLDLMFEKEPLRAVEKEMSATKPAVVGLSVRNIDNNDMQNPVFYPAELKSIMERIRMVSVAPVVLGGAAMSVMPEALLRFTGADYAVHGAGEVVFPKLVRSIIEGGAADDLPGVLRVDKYVIRKNECSSDGLTDCCRVPDFRRWINAGPYLSRLSSVPVQTKVGCHFQCVYCTYRRAEGGGYRLSSPESVVQAVSALSKAGFQDIEFVDNVFNSPYDHAAAICEGLAGMKGHARLQSLELNPFFIDDALLDSMEKAGFRGIGVTVESASDKVLNGLGKGFNSRHVQMASEVIARHRIPCMWIFMVGGPGETDETVRETLRFAENSICPGDVAFFNIGVRIYPGTALEARARQEGILSLSAEDMLKPVFYLSPGLDFRWMIEEVRRFMGVHMNVMNSDSLGLSFLPFIQRLACSVGVKAPLWRRTRTIRGMLRLLRL
ncbi:MAG: radical SAM protein [Nitrospirae bacterium]|nr:radical SAM protein [Nitrospirota bacterium]